jgi:hypothetical protein
VAKVALGALTAGFGAAAVIGLGFAKAAAEEEVGVARLGVSLRNLGGEFVNNTDAIEKQIAAMERTTAFSDGELRDALATLIDMTGSYDEALKRLPVAADLAREKQIKLGDSSKLLGKFTEESIGSLRKLIPTIKEGATGAEAFGEIQMRVAGQSAAFAASATGKWEIFNHTLDNLKEDIGGALLPAFSGLADVATGAIDGIRAALANPEIAATLKGILEGLTTTVSIVGELFGVISGTAPDAGAALTRALGPEAASSIMSAVATIREGFKAAFSFITGTIIPSVVQAFAFLKENWDVAGPAIAAVATFVIVPAMVAWAAGAAAAAVATIIALAPVLIPIAAIGAAVAVLALAWRENFGDIQGKVQAVIGFVTDTFDLFQREGLGGLLKAVVEFALSVPQRFVEMGKGIITGVLAGLAGLKDALWGAIRAAFESIDFSVGPFHISGTGGITVQMPTISLPQIRMPSFAGGGSFITGGPMPIMVGDNASGRELVSVTPLDRGGVARAMGGGLGQPLEIPVIINGREVARALGPAVIPLATLATGRRL